MKGANPDAGASREAYQAELEAQHAFNLGSVRHVLLDGVYASESTTTSCTSPHPILRRMRWSPGQPVRACRGSSVHVRSAAGGEHRDR